MDNNFKNTIVLNNLPSNIIDQAIIILKKGVKTKELEKVDKSKFLDCEKVKYKEKEYIVKEAEMLVDNCIKEIENKNNNDKIKLKIDEKCKKLKKIILILSFISVIQFVFLIS